MGHQPETRQEKIILKLFPDNLEGFKILDCGFGYGYWGYTLRIMKKGVFKLVGIDLFDEYILKQSKLNVYDEIIKHDLRFKTIFKDKSFDIILASHIIEHFPKKKSLELLRELERICKLRIILATPFNEKIDLTNYLKKAERYNGNPLNYHLSSWKIDDLKNIGYNTILCRRDEFRLKSMRILDIIPRIYYFVIRKRLQRFYIIAYKDLL